MGKFSILIHRLRREVRIHYYLKLHLGRSSWSKILNTQTYLANHSIIVLLDEVSVFLQNLVESGLDAVLAAAQRVAVTVQQPVHVGAFHHLHQDGCQLTLQSQQTLLTQTQKQYQVVICDLFYQHI